MRDAHAVRRLVFVGVLLAGLALVSCSSERAPQCNFEARSTSVPVGTTQRVKVISDHVTGLDFAGAIWVPGGVMAYQLPPIGTDLEVTLVRAPSNQRDGEASVLLPDGTT